MKFKDLEGLKPYEKVLLDKNSKERSFVALVPGGEHILIYSEYYDSFNRMAEEQIKDWTFKEEKKEIVCYETSRGYIETCVKGSAVDKDWKMDNDFIIIPCPWEQE